MDDGVRDFTNNTFFGNNLLTVSKITDENEKLSYQFKDKLGRVVLEKKQLISPLTGVDVNDYASTYSIYDDFGRLYVTLPPEAVKKMKTSNNWNYLNSIYSGMIFKYTYDDRGRLVSKTVPSGGTSTYAYDRLDRAVMVTDPNGVKMITRYDVLSRPIISGKYIGTSAPAVGNPLYEIASTAATTHYYTATTFPTDNNNVQVYKAFYYDDYDLNNDGTVATTEQYTNPVEVGYETSAFGRTRGLATATRVGVLKVDNTAPTTFLINRIYYDKELRVIQTNAQNHLSGADIESSSYDFADRIVKKRRDHTATPPGGTAKAYTIREDYVYDHAGRTLFVAHQVGTQKREIIAAFTYDELGRVLTRKLHASNFSGTPLPTPGTSYSYLQTLDYTYNIRGWMTGINDPANCNMQAGNDNLDLFKLGLYYEAPPSGWTPQYNGNIAAAEWRVYKNSSCQTRHAYRFTYDANNRLSAAAHHTFVLGSWSLTNNYSESGIAYDNNGNIKNYTRRGVTTGTSTFGVIDQLTYYFDDAVNPDRLTRVVDAGSATKGFVYAPPASGNHYLYDAAGNLTEDKHKKFTVAYNHLNLPRLLTFTDGSGRKIEFVYTADGAKLGQKALTNTTINSEKNYVNGIEYNGANTEAIYHSEGRLTPNGATAWYYEYSLRDHLGNARVNFRANGAAPQFLDEHHYYPFGMEMEGFAGGGSPYRYNNKEITADFGVNWYFYGARWYDAAVGRWWSVDPLAEKYRSWSGYNYAMDNPVKFIDPDGRDIIISYGAGADKATKEQKAAYEKAILTALSNLTNDKLKVENGKVVIEKSGDGDTKKESTALLRLFINGGKNKLGNDIMPSVAIKRTTISGKDENGKPILQDNATTVVDLNSSLNGSKDASNGIGVELSNIAYDPENDNGTGHRLDGKEDKENANDETVLLHELVHAEANARGERASTGRNSCTNCKRANMSLEEGRVQYLMRTKYHPDNPIFIPKNEDPYKK